MNIDLQDILKAFDIPPLESLNQTDVAFLTESLRSQNPLLIYAVLLRLLGGNAYFNSVIKNIADINDNLIAAEQASAERQNILESRIEQVEKLLEDMSYMTCMQG